MKDPVEREDNNPILKRIKIQESSEDKKETNESADFDGLADILAPYHISERKISPLKCAILSYIDYPVSDLIYVFPDKSNSREIVDKHFPLFKQVHLTHEEVKDQLDQNNYSENGKKRKKFF